MAKLIIKEHSNKEHVTEVENYDAAAVFRQMQNAYDSGMHMILIGSVLVDVRSINSVSLVPEPEAPAEKLPESETESE